MKSIIYNLVCLFSISVFVNSCSDDNNHSTDGETENALFPLSGQYETDRLRILELSPNENSFTNATFQWVIKKKNSVEDSIKINTRKLSFICMYPGIYSVKLKIQENNTLIEKTTQILVNKEKVTYSPYINKVYDFLPAVGQFTNELPTWNNGDSKESMIIKANNAITGSKPTMISLGGFGGYVVFGFDHTIMNIDGKRDFKILGNAFWSNSSEKTGSSEPGIIMVSYDKNKNGIPDDEWYEIAGSEYYKNQTLKNYSITYYKPGKPEVPGANPTYIKWEDNTGNSGYKSKNAFHSQSYFPEWIIASTLTFSGTKLADNYTDISGNGSYWTGKSYDFGYADNAPNNSEESNIDIDWAVDKNGNKVKLPGIDFVKVYTGINQEAGWLGEISTEITGAYDLHLLK